MAMLTFDFWVRAQANPTAYNRNMLQTGKVEVFKKKPSVNANQVTLNVKLELPEALFKTPHLQATLSVPEDSVAAPVIDAKVSADLAQVLSERLGVHVSVMAEGMDDGDEES